MTDHALITWLSCTAHVADHAMITQLPCTGHRTPTRVQLFKAGFSSHPPTVPSRSGALVPFLALGKLLTSGHFILWFPLSRTFFPQLCGVWLLPPSCLSLRSLPSRERERERSSKCSPEPETNQCQHVLCFVDCTSSPSGCELMN